jgi:hypothetical protein
MKAVEDRAEGTTAASQDQRVVLPKMFARCFTNDGRDGITFPASEHQRTEHREAAAARVALSASNVT